MWIKALTALASIFSSVRGKLRKVVTSIPTKGTVDTELYFIFYSPGDCKIVTTVTENN